MTEETTTSPSTESPSPIPRPALLRGTRVAPGLAMGSAYRKEYDLAKVGIRRVPREQVETELNRFHSSLWEAKRQLEDLKGRLRGMVPEDHARILDTHVAYLKDSVFLSDVENLILNEQMSLEGAIAKVITDFDRIFRLVKSDTLRERAVDLRDVGIRVLRNLERAGGLDAEPPAPQEDTILIARELSIVDMFNLDNEHVRGILTEAGSLTSHAAILARSMRIPTLTGVENLLDEVREGDFVILDGAEGVARIRPDEIVRAQYREASAERERSTTAERPDWARFPARTSDGEEVLVAATCGNLPEVERAHALGMEGVGLYRTELLYLLDREPPSLDSLIAHYQSVITGAAGSAVTFRLLDLDSNVQLGYLYEGREQNPVLGRMGVRALLAHEPVLRRQLQAIARAATGAPVPVRIAVPKVIDCGELRRVKEVLFEELFALKKAKVDHQERIETGVVIETPAAAFGIDDFAREADFLIVSFNSLQQYLLAADRDNGALASYFSSIHPYVLRLLGEVVRTCAELEKPLSIFGVTAAAGTKYLPLLVGLGLRSFSIPPIALKSFLEHAQRIDLAQAESAAGLAARATCPAELNPVLSGYGHGFAGRAPSAGSD